MAYLGQPRGPARVLDLGDLIRIGLPVFQSLLVLGRELPSIRQRFQAMVSLFTLTPHLDDVSDLRIFLQHILDDRPVGDLSVLLGQHPGHRLRQLADMVDLGLVVAWDEDDGDGAYLLKSQEREDEFMPVRQLEEHPLFRLDAQFHKTDGQLIHRLAELPVGPSARTVHKPDFVWVNIRVFIKDVPPGHPQPPSHAAVLLNLFLPIGCETFDRHMQSP